MEFEGQEQNQEPGTEQPSQGGYDYPILNRALLEGFASRGAAMGDRGTAGPDGNRPTIGERIVDMTAQQSGVSRIPRPEREPDVAAPQLRVVDMQKPLAGLSGLMTAPNQFVAPSPAGEKAVGEVRDTGNSNASGQPAGKASPATAMPAPANGVPVANPLSPVAPGSAALKPVKPGSQPDAVHGNQGQSLPAARPVQPGVEQTPAGGSPVKSTSPVNGKPESIEPKTGVPGADKVGQPLANSALEEVARRTLPGAIDGKTSKGKPVLNPQNRIQQNLPAVATAMQKNGLTDPAMMAYALATIRAETSSFRPLREGANPSNTTKGGKPFDKYDHSAGNLGPPDGATYRGRGYIQLTGRGNYERMQKDTGLPLLEHPELAEKPENAAIIFAQYLKWHEGELKNALNKGDLVAARAVVNGRKLKSDFLPNGLENFLPGMQMAQRQSAVANAVASNPNLTVGEVARTWTQNDPAKDSAAYQQGLQQRLKIDPATKLSELTPQQRQQLEADQAAHVGQMVKNDMPRIRAEAKVQQEAWRKRQAEKAAAAAARKAKGAAADGAKPGQAKAARGAATAKR
ncbi:MAG TPA: hypothetical protein VNW97_14480 [Candidatus Saccharimonadales bacterium]|jgi:predicted chitinase|nr:hypothetical protein [Candidatus Saccharimonadales bacterium]